MPPQNLRWQLAIEQTLAASDVPLRADEIVERIVANGLRTSVGATPEATVQTTISESFRWGGAQSPFVRVSRGLYTVVSRLSAPAASQVAQPATPQEAEAQYDIVTSFGMFWRRNAIEWTATPKLLGMQQLGSTHVDFNNQLGIYLLYDGREVIYIGRSTDRPLGRRLYEHTSDRLAVRWDRFSWFGLLPVSEAGALGTLPATYDALKIIPALEAILIEALEPRQNRKRGDDLSAVEYIQQEDPAIQRRRVRESLELALNKL